MPRDSALGVRPQLLSGTEEARLSFLGATAELDPADGPFLVVDIGGGSTEFSFGGAEAEAGLSTDMGCVRFTEKYLEHDPPRPEELVAALSVAEAYVDDVRQAIPDLGEARTFVGLAGTVSTAAAVEIGLAAYDRDRIHHFELTKAAVEDVFRTLATETRAQRLENPGLEEARADVIVGGLLRAGHHHAPAQPRGVPGQRSRHPRRARPLAARLSASPVAGRDRDGGRQVVARRTLRCTPCRSPIGC